MKQKTDSSKLRGIIGIAVYAVLVMIATVVMTESRGILRTLPLIFILPAAATFFYNKKLLTTLLCFFITLIFAVVESATVFDAVFTAVFALFFAGAGIIAKRLFVTAFVSREKRVLCTVLGVLLAVLGIVGYGCIFGNPFSALSAKSRNEAYISETYGENAPEEQYTYYDVAERRYFTNVSFTDESRMNADISAKNSEVFDGYRNYYEYKFLVARREELAKVLADHFSNEQFALRINIAETDIEAFPDSDPSTFYGDMVFDIAFYDQLTESAGFAEKCGEYSDYLFEIGFEFGTVNYYGGFGDEFMFQMAVPGNHTGDYGELTQPFSGEEFDRYYDESDYADGWYYGD